MEHKGEQNRRRNQIIAQRTVQKIDRETVLADVASARLWAMIHDALGDAVNSAVYNGHVGRASKMALAEQAAHQLWMRGEQLTLFPD